MEPTFSNKLVETIPGRQTGQKAGQPDRNHIESEIRTSQTKFTRKKKEICLQILLVAVIELNKKSIIYAYQTGIDSWRQQP